MAVIKSGASSDQLTIDATSKAARATLYNTAGAAAAIDSNTSALRVNPMPMDVGALGSYQVSVVSGTIGAGLGAASPIFSMRWGNASNAALIRRLSVAARCLGTAFTAGATLFEMMMARAFTASDSAGTAVTLTTNNAKKRTNFGTSLVTDMRISSTATLTAGTRTLDAQPIAQVRGFVPATQVNYPMIGEAVGFAPGASTLAFALRPFNIFFADMGNDWPIVLRQDEGVILRATVPATGTFEAIIEVEWDEVPLTSGMT